MWNKDFCSTVHVLSRATLFAPHIRTLNHLFSPLLLKSTVITDDDSPPAFYWNVKMTHTLACTHTHTHTRACVIRVPVKPICSFSSIFNCSNGLSHPSRISVLSASVSRSANVPDSLHVQYVSMCVLCAVFMWLIERLSLYISDVCSKIRCLIWF